MKVAVETHAKKERGQKDNTKTMKYEDKKSNSREKAPQQSKGNSSDDK